MKECFHYFHNHGKLPLSIVSPQTIGFRERYIINSSVEQVYLNRLQNGQDESPDVCCASLIFVRVRYFSQTKSRNKVQSTSFVRNQHATYLLFIVFLIKIIRLRGALRNGSVH